MENKVENLLCMACLCVGRTLSNVVDERLKQYYLEVLSEMPMCAAGVGCLSVCWECAALLRRAFSFREQLKDSYRILHTYANETLRECLLSDVSRPPRLKIHNTSAVYISPVIEIEVDSEDKWAEIKTDDDFYKIDEAEPEKLEKEEPEQVKKEVETETLWVDDSDKMEVKQEKDLSDIDNDDCLFPSDDSDDMADLEREINAYINKSDSKDAKVKKKKKSKIDKENKVKKAKKVIRILQKEKKQGAVGTKKLPGKCEEPKIRTLELSYEEMLEERARDATREAYLRADFKCELCLVGFSYEKCYKEHRTTRHSPDIGDYSCPICKTVIASVESFTAHYKRHMRRYECAVCGKRTMDRKVMVQHYDSVHEATQKEYKCHICGKISNSLDAHRYHKDSHKARVECGECNKTFSHRAGLMNHRISVHKLNNMFPCTVCDKVFRWKTSLKKHVEKHERKGKPPDNAPYCEPCGVSFSSVCTYQRHMKNSLKHVTENELKFICADCGRKFANKTKLRDHIEEKHLYKTYQCPICLKPSKNRVCLDQHVRNVHKGRPNNKMCHHCGKGFPTNVQLESHMRSHTGERPFICEFCPTTFSQQSNLYKHNRQVHMNIKAKRYPMCRKKKEKRPVTLPPPPDPALNPHHADLFHLVM